MTRKTVGPYSIKEHVPKIKGTPKYLVNGPTPHLDGEPFGKLGTAVRWCKRQIPRQPPHIVVNMDDKSAVATEAVDYTVIDGPYKHTAAAEVNPQLVRKITETET
jgi:hypothetical protein